MSNKAIVFYTGELLEVQENSLREAHGVENIIFVPVENKDDLNTKILETTEQPFKVYNYLTDPDLIIAVCDKLSSFTAETGFLPEYFIWVDKILREISSRREEITAEVSNSKPIVINVNGGAAKQLIGRAKRLPITRVIVITEETLSRSLRLSPDQVNDSIDVININIPATDEEHVKRVFDDKVFRGYTKPTFVIIDDRHKYADTICTLVKTMNVYGNINVKIIDMRDKSLNEIIKQQTDLEVQERFETMKATQMASLELQYNKPGELHVDVSGMSMPDSIKAVKERVEKFKEMQTFKDIRDSMKDFDPNEPRPDPYLSYGEAIEMCKKGIDVTCVNWRAGEFLTVNTGAVVHADNFWSPGNKRTAMANPDQSLSVFPHFLRTTKYGTVPHMVDFNDQFSDWVVASDRIKVKTVSVDDNKFTLHYALDTFSTAEFELAPFWPVYDVLADLSNNVTVITDNDANVLVHIIASMKEAHDNQRQIVEESFEIYNGRIPEELHNRGVSHYPMIGLNNTIEAIRQGTFTHVIVDSDSFKTDLRLDAIKTALQEAKVNWASISVKEQLFGIYE